MFEFYSSNGITYFGMKIEVRSFNSYSLAVITIILIRARIISRVRMNCKFSNEFTWNKNKKVEWIHKRRPLLLIKNESLVNISQGNNFCWMFKYNRNVEIISLYFIFEKFPFYEHSLIKKKLKGYFFVVWNKLAAFSIGCKIIIHYK